MNISIKDILGKWQEFTLNNDYGMSVSVLNYGGIITKILVADQSGEVENVVLSYRNYEDYESNPHFLGTIVGRVAGRIKESSFQIDDKVYHLEANNGPNHLHGGPQGFHQIIWEAKPFQTDNEVGLRLTHKSPDGEGGYPGNMEVTVTYTLTNDNQLILDYAATTDQPTPIALTNHSYFNLSGNLVSTVHNHLVTIDSSKFVELDQNLIPTGKVLDVEETPFDFRQGLPLRTGFNDSSKQNSIVGNGYDHYFMFDHSKASVVTMEEPTSGRSMTIQTNQPGMVMYTSNGLDEGVSLAENTSEKYLGVCFETQGSPASLHHDAFPTILLKGGERYEQKTIFTFSAIK
ncbi:aldose 1-epimerase [Bacillus mesophilus]|uniref:Aldose 1-epimerase n=1 Tax=Bacillus mesophilus TaxID=1808955 RepID=A0A6M0QA46_9BACI|nr:aldose epimerase family protein [Bacillus mesophilus]MBM7662727.1 aldose 1-epimerase [Bacillus mesophilus]NEY73212.1 galactose mutarotase [Bacillus mesophilus]